MVRIAKRCPAILIVKCVKLLFPKKIRKFFFTHSPKQQWTYFISTYTLKKATEAAKGLVSQHRAKPRKAKLAYKRPYVCKVRKGRNQSKNQ